MRAGGQRKPKLPPPPPKLGFPAFPFRSFKDDRARVQAWAQARALRAPAARARLWPAALGLTPPDPQTRRAPTSR